MTFIFKQHLFMLNKTFSWVFRLPKNWVLNAATLGPIGGLSQAPGTLGSIVGVVFYTLFFYPLPSLTYLILLGACIYAGAGICERASSLMGQADPSAVVLDECIAVPLCFMGLEGAMQHHPMWLILLAGLGLFRFFDILKPIGIKHLEQFKGGWGIMVDDLAAALATCICLHLGLLILT